jgi:uncharacterized membrane protein (Fun14 family)
MVFVIASSGGHRNQTKSWRSKSVVFGVGGVAAGIACGGVLGWLGGWALAADERVGLAVIAASVAVVLGVVELAGRRVPLPQWNRETPQEWMDRGAFTGAFLNGAALGSGFATRIGFWLWYAVPVAALLSGSVVLGVALYGTYAAVRVGVTLLLLVSNRWRTARSGMSLGAITPKILALRPVARTISAWQLLGVATTTLIASNV